MEEKITLVYGIEQCAIAKIKDDKTHEYDKPIMWPSVTKLSESTKESTETFFADNGVWAVINGQSEIDGKLDCYTVPSEIAEYLGWEERDKNGLSVEVTTPSPAHCALLYTYRTQGPKKIHKRACLYDVTFTKPNLDLSTVKEKIDPSNFSISFKAVPIKIDGFDNEVTKSKTTQTSSEEIYSNWYQAVKLPTAKEE